MTIFLVTAVCLVAAGITLYSQIATTRQVDRELAAANLSLRTRSQRYAHRSLPQKLAEAEQQNQRLQQTWEQHRLQVDTFHGTLPERARIAASGDARIDFKVARFNAHEALQELAAANSVKLTDELGIEETIDTEEDTEARLWELGSLVRLAELLISGGVESIDTIVALPPFVYADVPDENEHTLAFPVKVSLQCEYAQLQPLLRALSQEDCFYAISQCDVSRPSLGSQHLRVQLVCSALRFLVGTSTVELDDEDVTLDDRGTSRRRGDPR